MKGKKIKAKSKEKVQQSMGESKEWSRGRELRFLIAQSEQASFRNAI